MNKRLSKQLIYGSGFFTVIFLFLLTAYFVFLKSAPSCFDNKQNQNEAGIDCGGVCAPCEMKTLLPLKSDWVKYFSVNNKAAITAQIRNSNTNYAADYFFYTFDIYDKNKNKIKSIEDRSFVYNSDVKYLFEITDIDYSNISNVDLLIGRISWKSKEEFKKPKVSIREEITKAGENEKGIEVSGILVNENPFLLSKATIVSFLNNNNKIKISVSKTELENLESFSEKPFKIFFPIEASLLSPESIFNVNLVDPNKTEIHIEAR